MLDLDCPLGGIRVERIVKILIDPLLATLELGQHPFESRPRRLSRCHRSCSC